MDYKNIFYLEMLEKITFSNILLYLVLQLCYVYILLYERTIYILVGALRGIDDLLNLRLLVAYIICLEIREMRIFWDWVSLFKMKINLALNAFIRC